MTAFVLDNAMTMAWCFTDEATPDTEALLDSLSEPHQIVVPVLWRYEVANVLLLAVRKNRITTTKAREFIEDLQSFTIEVDEGSSRVFDSVYEIAEQFRLTSYDAAYLEVAIRRQLPLATLDEDLRKAAAGSGVTLFQVRSN